MTDRAGNASIQSPPVFDRRWPLPSQFWSTCKILAHNRARVNAGQYAIANPQQYGWTAVLQKVTKATKTQVSGKISFDCKMQIENCQFAIFVTTAGVGSPAPLQKGRVRGVQILTITLRRAGARRVFWRKRAGVRAG